jgi:hypothetical protein
LPKNGRSSRAGYVEDLSKGKGYREWCFVIARRLKLEDNVQRVDDAGNVTQNRQQDVDEEVGIASTLEEHTQRREDNGEDDLDDVASGEGHVEVCLSTVQDSASGVVVYQKAVLDNLVCVGSKFVVWLSRSKQRGTGIYGRRGFVPS